jgi:hypothetical protein
VSGRFRRLAVRDRELARWVASRATEAMPHQKFQLSSLLGLAFCSTLRQQFCLGISRCEDHVGGMRLHGIFIIVAGTMIAMSTFLVLRAHHKVGSTYAGLIDVQCSNPPDNELIPVEQACEKPSPNAIDGR